MKTKYIFLMSQWHNIYLTILFLEEGDFHSRGLQDCRDTQQAVGNVGLVPSLAVICGEVRVKLEQWARSSRECLQNELRGKMPTRGI